MWCERLQYYTKGPLSYSGGKEQSNQGIEQEMNCSEFCLSKDLTCDSVKRKLEDRQTGSTGFCTCISTLYMKCLWSFQIHLYSHQVL